MNVFMYICVYTIYYLNTLYILSSLIIQKFDLVLHSLNILKL